MVKRFRLGNAAKVPSVILTEAEHKRITAELMAATREVKDAQTLWKVYQDIVVLRILKQHDVLWLEYHKDVFTEEEFNSARLLLMQTTREAEVCGGVECGMTYDLSGACPACGTGGKQTSAVFVDAENLGNLEGQRAGSIIFSHILVDAGLATELVRIGATGISFRDVSAVTRDKRQFKLPSGSSAPRGRSRPCPPAPPGSSASGHAKCAGGTGISGRPWGYGGPRRALLGGG
jgi:hypothetical protein